MTNWKKRKKRRKMCVVVELRFLWFVLSIYNIHDDPFHSTVLCTTWFDSERLFSVRICVERVQLRLIDKIIICPNRSREIFHYQGHLRYFTRHNVTVSDVCQWWRLRYCWIVPILFFWFFFFSLRLWCGVREIYRWPNNVRHTISMANENSHANTTQLPYNRRPSTEPV